MSQYLSLGNSDNRNNLRLTTLTTYYISHGPGVELSVCLQGIYCGILISDNHCNKILHICLQLKHIYYH
jgi:hypothetical protein